MSKPWANEPTPATDAVFNNNTGADGCTDYFLADVLLDHARELEQRARHAEALMAEAALTCHADVYARCADHLAAARQEDGE